MLLVARRRGARLAYLQTMTAKGWRDRSRENLRAAEILTDNELLKNVAHETVKSFWNPASSRIYYSLFQAVVGKLVEKNLKPVDIFCPDPDKWQHDKVNSACKTKLNDPHLGRVFRNAMSLRERADYEPLSSVSASEFRDLESQVRPVLQTLGVNS